MGAQQRSALLTSPIFAASILLLLANDHVLKGAWPGLVTGKLSDIAGVVMIAIASAAVLGRAGVAVTATAVGFGLLKSVPLVAEWSAPVLGGVVRTDPYDLLALAVLVPVWSWLRSRPAIGVDDQPRRRMTIRIALVSAAVFATTATGCDTKGVAAIYVYDDVLLASASDGEYRSADGGLSWQEWPDDVSIDWESLERQTRACADGVCFQADEPNGRLTETTDATDATPIPVLALDASQQEDLRSLGNRDCVSQAFETIAAVGLVDEQHVVVSMGPAGALHRGPDGSWEWVRIGRWGLPDDVDETYFGLPVAEAG